MARDPDLARAEAAVRELMLAYGIAPEGEMEGTPRRVAEMGVELLAGVLSPDEPLEVIEGPDTPVMIEKIRFFSLCAHHLLPFFGHATVGYIPAKGRILGLGTLCHIVDLAARRPTLQERLAEDIASRIDAALSPAGVYVKLEALQLCVMMRGPRQAEAVTTTVARRGLCRTEEGMLALFGSGEGR